MKKYLTKKTTFRTKNIIIKLPKRALSLEEKIKIQKVAKTRKVRKPRGMLLIWRSCSVFTHYQGSYTTVVNYHVSRQNALFHHHYDKRMCRRAHVYHCECIMQFSSSEVHSCGWIIGPRKDACVKTNQSDPLESLVYTSFLFYFFFPSLLSFLFSFFSFFFLVCSHFLKSSLLPFLRCLPFLLSPRLQRVKGLSWIRS